MADVNIRVEGRAGWITLTRPHALNALSRPMAQEIYATLRSWRTDPAVDLVILDAEGERAFCAGGDIAAMYEAGRRGEHAESAAFFADEYRLNTLIHEYPKPIVAFMQGFVMGGGVGLGGHSSHRIVGQSTRVAMPETGIGLIPDVGGTWLLSRAPGHLGEYLGLTGARMEPGDAIHAGFADYFIPETEWPAIKDRLARTGQIDLPRYPAPESGMAKGDYAAFALPDMDAIRAAVTDEAAQKAMDHASPLSLAATLALVRAARGDDDFRDAIAREYRFTSRATAKADFIEGVRAQIIDKDRTPNWSVPATQAGTLLDPLGKDELTWEDEV